MYNSSSFSLVHYTCMSASHMRRRISILTILLYTLSFTSSFKMNTRTYGLFLHVAMSLWNWIVNGSIVYPRDGISVNMEQRWNDTVRENSKNSEKNLSQFYFVHHKRHTDWAQIRASAVRCRRLTVEPVQGPKGRRGAYKLSLVYQN